jgi:hypothetical protein
MNDRLKMGGYEYNEEDVIAGNMTDVRNTLDNLLVLYRKKNTVEASVTPEGTKRNAAEHNPERQWTSDVPALDSYKRILEVAQNMTIVKNKRRERWSKYVADRAGRWERRSVL